MAFQTGKVGTVVGIKRDMYNNNNNNVGSVDISPDGFRDIYFS